MENIFFFQTQQIDNNSKLFDTFKQQNIYFSYFQVDQNCYLFVYAQQSIDTNLLYQSIEIIEELDSKQRKIRSLRGFFLYALEIMEKGKDYEILNTNLQPFFWKKVKNTIQQNRKTALQHFLFGKATINQDQTLVLIPHLEDQIQTLKSQVDSLQQRIIQLENNQNNQTLPKEQIQKAISGTLNAPENGTSFRDEPKTIQHSNYSVEVEKGPNLIENENKTEDLQQPIYKNPLEGPISPKNDTLDLETSNLPFKQGSAVQRPNFIKLSNIDEQERIEIIQKGFQHQAEGKISLKKYYESKDSNSLCQLKGYSIKYDTIRKNKLYQQLKK